jgi:hypothetical protein
MRRILGSMTVLAQSHANNPRRRRGAAVLRQDGDGDSGSDKYVLSNDTQGPLSINTRRHWVE